MELICENRKRLAVFAKRKDMFCLYKGLYQEFGNRKAKRLHFDQYLRAGSSSYP